MAAADAVRLLRHARVIRDDDPDEAVAAASKAGSLYKKAGDAPGMLRAYRSMISAAIAKKDLERAAQMAFERQASFASAGDAASEALMWVSIAELHLAIGHGSAQTVEAADGALALLKEAGGLPAMEAEALVMASRAYLATGDPVEAASLAKRGAALYEQASDSEGRAEALLEQCRALTSRSFSLVPGTPTEASALQEEALQAALEAVELSESHTRAQAYQLMADVMLSKHKAGEAMRLAKEAIAFYKELGSLAGELSVFPTMVSIHIQKGEPQEALRMLKARLATYQLDIVKAMEEKKKTLAARMIKLQAELSSLAMAAYVAAADTAGALQVGREVLPIFQGLGDKQGEAATVLRIAEVYLQMRLVVEGISWANRAHGLFRELGNKAGIDAAAAVQSVLCSEPGGDPLSAINRPKSLAELKKLKQAADSRDEAAFKTHLEKALAFGGTSDQDFTDIVAEMAGEKAEVLEWMRGIEDIKWGKAPMKCVQYERAHLYQWFVVGGMGYGPHFQCLNEVYQIGKGKGDTRETYGVGILRQHGHQFPDEAQSWEDGTLCLHPGLADCGLQVGAIMAGSGIPPQMKHPEAQTFEFPL
mmetsp:Transcript_59772/g.142246  ORF Transcript_59772/g.142246 Transcript_59772/m.142246 type:complete len:592 (-) Transcript_59772:232-2007(-)